MRQLSPHRESKTDGYRFPLSQRTLPALLRTQCEERSDTPFIRFIDGEAATFGGFTDRCLSLAAGLRTIGVQKHETVALFLTNRIEFVEAWFATSLLGAIEVPINTEFRGPLLEHVLRDSQASVLITEVTLLARLAGTAALDQVKTVVVDLDTHSAAERAGQRMVSYDDLLAEAGDWKGADQLAHCDPISVMYTSGTTGRSKGVVSSHHQYYVWAESLARNMGLTEHDSYYHCLPLFYGDAQFFAVYFALIFGTTVTFSPRFSAANYWSDVASSEATATNLLGAMTHILWKQAECPSDARTNLRVCNAIPMPSFKEAFERRFNVELVTGYGQTETNMVAYSRPGRWREGSCGQAGPEFEIFIVDALDEPVPPGTVGEIVVRARTPWTILTEYRGLPSETAMANRNHWFHTGDSGYLDEDGWLFFVDRMKDSIRRRGQNISAQEVESVILNHPAVRDVAAVAVPSELSEDEVKVVVSTQSGQTITPTELIDYCVPRMARFMVPRYVEIRAESLPMTASEKVAKAILRDEGLGPTTWDRETAGYEVPR